MRCPKCCLDKDLQSFAKNRAKKSGHASLCKECQKPYKDAHYRRNKQDYFARSKEAKKRKLKLVEDYKVSVGCKCGEKHPATLDLHHRDPSSKAAGVSVLAVNCASDDVIMDEIAKCEVLCSNCHRKLHWKS